MLFRSPLKAIIEQIFSALLGVDNNSIYLSAVYLKNTWILKFWILCDEARKVFKFQVEIDDEIALLTLYLKLLTLVIVK